MVGGSWWVVRSEEADRRRRRRLHGVRRDSTVGVFGGREEDGGRWTREASGAASWWCAGTELNVAASSCSCWPCQVVGRGRQLCEMAGIGDEGPSVSIRIRWIV